MTARECLRCRWCGSALSAYALECPACGSRRPFVCAVCGRPVGVPLHLPQLREGGLVICARHAPWVRCAVCGREGIHGEVTRGEWVYLGDCRARGRNDHYPELSRRLTRLKVSERWLCPACRCLFWRDCRGKTSGIGRAVVLAGGAALLLGLGWLLCR